MLHLSKYEKEAAESATLIVTISKYSLKKIVQLYQISKEKIRIVPMEWMSNVSGQMIFLTRK